MKAITSKVVPKAMESIVGNVEQFSQGNSWKVKEKDQGR